MGETPDFSMIIWFFRVSGGLKRCFDATWAKKIRRVALPSGLAASARASRSRFDRSRANFEGFALARRLRRHRETARQVTAQNVEKTVVLLDS